MTGMYPGISKKSSMTGIYPGIENLYIPSDLKFTDDLSKLNWKGLEGGRAAQKNMSNIKLSQHDHINFTAWIFV